MRGDQGKEGSAAELLPRTRCASNTYIRTKCVSNTYMFICPEILTEHPKVSDDRFGVK